MTQDELIATPDGECEYCPPGRARPAYTWVEGDPCCEGCFHEHCDRLAKEWW